MERTKHLDGGGAEWSERNTAGRVPDACTLTRPQASAQALCYTYCHLPKHTGR